MLWMRNMDLDTSCDKCLDISETKMLRRILDQIINENNNWRIWYNNALYEIYKWPPLSLYARLQGLQWEGHVARMEENRIPKRSLNPKMYDKRPLGIPKKRSENEANEDARKLLQIRSWKRWWHIGWRGEDFCRRPGPTWAANHWMAVYNLCKLYIIYLI